MSDCEYCANTRIDKATDGADKTPPVSFVSPVAEIEEAIGVLCEVAL